LGISANVSERIEIIRFPLIIGVLFIHNYGYQETFRSGVLGLANIPLSASFVQDLFSQSLARVVVPLFYVISGYLFFNGFSGTFEGYVGKLKKRISSLLVPFVLWNIGLLVLLIILQNSHATRMFFNPARKPILNYDFFDYISALIGINRNPVVYQMWFIRNLMIMIALSPLIYYLACNLRNVTLVLLVGLWYVNGNLANGSESLLFFYIGCYLSVIDINMEYMDPYGIISVILFFVLAAADATTQATGYWVVSIHKIMICVGVVSVWTLTKKCMQTKLSKLLTYLSPYAFFVFAFHEPLLASLKKIIFRYAAPHASYFFVVLYFAIPLIVVAISLSVGIFMNTVFPKVYCIATGNRARFSQSSFDDLDRSLVV
jgi:surface polysaccharide O-acyltransferase-like enzyme